MPVLVRPFGDEQIRIARALEKFHVLQRELRRHQSHEAAASFELVLHLDEHAHIVRRQTVENRRIRLLFTKYFLLLISIFMQSVVALGSGKNSQIRGVPERRAQRRFPKRKLELEW